MVGGLVEISLFTSYLEIIHESRSVASGKELVSTISRPPPPLSSLPP